MNSAMKLHADDTIALNRRGLLIETVTASVNDILLAPAVQQALPQVLSAVANVVRIDRMVIIDALLDSDGNPTRNIFFRWEGPDAPKLADFSGLVRQSKVEAEWAWPLAQGHAVAGTVNTVPPNVRKFFDLSGIVSTLLVPIIVDGKHWGQICFDDCKGERDWASDDIKILKLLAGVIGVAITRERFLNEWRHREELLRAVTFSAAEIMTAPDLRQAISRALADVAQAVHADRIVLLEELESTLGAPRMLLRHAWHAPDMPLQFARLVQTDVLPPTADVQAWRAPLRQGIAVEGRLSEVHGEVKELFERFDAKSLLIVPIMVNGKLWGHVSIDDCRQERFWSPEEVDILKTLAGLIGTATTRERYVDQLAKANTIIQNSPTILCRLRGEPSFPLIYISQNVALFGHDPEAMVKEPELYFQFIHEDDRAAVQTALAEMLDPDAPGSTSEFRVLTHDGEPRWVENRYTPVRDQDGRLLEIEGVFADITERKLADEKISLLARTDPLTGLANRATFAERLRQAFAASRRGAHWFAVLYLDLDHFKEINDTFGHPVGDKLLLQVADRLRHGTREVDLVARLGGDEFAILQAEVSDSTVAGRLAEKLIDLLSAPYVVDGHDLRIGATIGISLYAMEAEGPDALLAQADQALYRAKGSGRGRYRFHSDQIDHDAREQLSLAEDLRDALARGELEIRYQPQVELASRKIVGMEAVLRWNHPIRGTLLPEDFVPIAEKFGIMQQLGRWVLDGACHQMSLWREEKLQVPVIAINVALAQIKMGREFVRDVTASIARWGLAPCDVELDVTELVLARATLAQSDVLNELRRIGIGIAIDDFGAQFSSLDYLRTYHVNRLKIARGMIAAAAAEPGGLAMVRAILSLATELGIEVVAEGIETEQQRDLLVQASAKAQGQGFYFGHAIAADDTSRILRSGLLFPEDSTQE